MIILISGLLLAFVPGAMAAGMSMDHGEMPQTCLEHCVEEAVSDFDTSILVETVSDAGLCIDSARRFPVPSCDHVRSVYSHLTSASSIHLCTQKRE